MAIKKEIEITANTKNANKNIEELDDKTKDASKSMADLESAADKFTGGFISGLKQVGSSLKGFGSGILNSVKSLKTFRLANIMTWRAVKIGIASTGIGLLIIALGSLVTYFSKTQRGADKMKVAFSAIGAVIDVLVDRVSTFGEGLFKIISGDFSDGLDILKSSFSGLGKELAEESAAAAQLTKDFQALEDREISMIETRAKTRAAVEAAKLLAADEKNTLEERSAALKKAMDLEIALSDQEIEIAKERARIIKSQHDLGEGSREDAQEDAEAAARVIELQAERDSKLKELVAGYNSFNNQIKASTDATTGETEAQKKLNEELEKRNERLASEAATLEEKLAAEYDAILQAQNDAQINEQNAIEDKYYNLLQSAEQYGFDEIELNRLKNEELAKVNKKYEDADSDRKKKKASDDKAVQMATLDAIGGALGSLSNLAGKDAASGKALSAASAVINTYTGATKALAQGGIAGPIAAAGVIATGIASIRQIYATKIPATDGGGGGGSRPLPQIPSALSPRLTLDTAASDLGNQITNSLGRSPVRAYVVNQDVQSAEKMDRKIRETATLG